MRVVRIVTVLAIGAGASVLAVRPRPDVTFAVESALVAGIGFVLVVATWRKPEVGLLCLVILLPFQHLLLARLYALGFNPQLVAASRFWKEAVFAALVLRWVARRWPPADKLDQLLLVFLCIVALYLTLPLGPPLLARVLGARQDAAYLLLLLVVRHLETSSKFPARLENTVLIVASIVAGLGLWNLFSPDGFSAWLESTGINEYQRRVLHVRPLPLIVRGTFGGIENAVRAGSIFLGHNILAYYLVIPVGIVVARLVGGRLKRWEAIAGGVCAAGLVATLTRSALLALPLMVLLAFSAGSRRSRLWIGLAIGVVALWPLGSYVGLEDQVRSAVDPSDVRTQGHVEQLSRSSQRILSEPLGSGLGTASYIGRRFEVPGNITNESWYFQIGTELGLIPMAIYMWIVVFTLRSLWRRARMNDVSALAAFCGLVVIALGGLVLHTLEAFQVAWTISVMVGLALRGPVVSASSQPDITVAGGDVSRENLPAPQEA